MNADYRIADSVSMHLYFAGANLAGTFPAVAALLAFAIVVGSDNLSGFMNDYLACGLALVASCIAWRSAQRRLSAARVARWCATMARSGDKESTLEPECAASLPQAPSAAFFSGLQSLRDRSRHAFSLVLQLFQQLEEFGTAHVLNRGTLIALHDRQLSL
ncbi:hypothetical protein N2603_38160 [Bradyrhizobium huanghuaihaiense]|uniref:hypothetical protein n=1 Tax=Bradyrhizobium huanghuaihaiense TaxID=990078 RepID=UPI0021AA57CC|nr:hypothetical protein [Bradyrhizobium sp. CB3035]UWU75750.1 hypothetical protein N2603_38160 [Bradyrhizobium sp. CB3035]